MIVATADHDGAPRRIVDELAQRQDAEEGEEQHGGRGQARIPIPPHAPRRLGPDRALAAEQEGRGRRRLRWPPPSARPISSRDLKRKMTAQTKANVIASSAFHAVGTCTYMIRCTCPINASGGATKRPMYEPMARKTMPRPRMIHGSRGKRLLSSFMCYRDRSLFDDVPKRSPHRDQ